MQTFTYTFTLTLPLPLKRTNEYGLSCLFTRTEVPLQEIAVSAKKELQHATPTTLIIYCSLDRLNNKTYYLTFKIKHQHQ